MQETYSGPEYEPRPEDKAKKPSVSPPQTTIPSTVSSPTSSTTGMNDEELQKLIVETEAQKVKDLKNVREEIEQIKDSNDKKSITSNNQSARVPAASSATNPEPEQDDEYYQGQGY